MSTKRKCGVCRNVGHDRRQCKILQEYLDLCGDDEENIAKELSVHLNAECCICLEKGNVHNKLECCGAFVHDNCIWRWIKSKSELSYEEANCPICRVKFRFMKNDAQSNLCMALNSKNEEIFIELNKYYGQLIVGGGISPAGNTYVMEMKEYDEEKLIKKLVARIRRNEEKRS